MEDLGVIDQFTNTFSQYIDTGFGLLRGEVAFLTATLVVIDITLAGLFWAMGGEDVIAKLIKKTLYVGASTSIAGITQGGGGILPAATAANATVTLELGPFEAVVITYTGAATARKMVH